LLERSGFEPTVPFLDFLTTTLDDGFHNGRLSSGCSRIGTESSNPLRSPNRHKPSDSLTNEDAAAHSLVAADFNCGYERIAFLKKWGPVAALVDSERFQLDPPFERQIDPLEQRLKVGDDRTVGVGIQGAPLKDCVRAVSIPCYVHSHLQWQRRAAPARQTGMIDAVHSVPQSHDNDGDPSSEIDSMECFVYVLGSWGKNGYRTYVGWTTDLDRRLAQHNAGTGARSTRGRVWVLLYVEQRASRHEAMSREWHLKRDRRLRKRLARRG